MSVKSNQFSTRLVLVPLLVVLLAGIGLLGCRGTAGSEQVTPTLMASAEAVRLSPNAEDEAGNPETEQAAEGETGNLVKVTLPPTNTPRTSPAATAGAQPTLSNTPKASGAPAGSPTPTPTSRPQLIPTLATITVTNSGGATAVPTAVPTFEIPPGTTNVLLLGSDISMDQGGGRTDTMIIVSINPDGPTASMVSLPRDMYVYIPGWTMNRINTALSRGLSAGYPGGAISQLTDTILYNFGVPIHYYAQVDFEGFKQGVDLIDGIDIAVSCKLTDWRLKAPGLDTSVEDNWEMFNLEPGVHHMDGDMALWYVRSRRTTSDFDRGRRQQQVLRAALNQGVDLNLVGRLPELWSTYQDTVSTNMDIGRLLQLAALAPAVRENGVQHLYLVGDQLQPWSVPGSGAAVQLPVWEKMRETLKRLFLPPALNQASRPPITVEVINSTDNPDLAVLAADNLAWYGFEPIIVEQDIEPQNTTSIQYYAQNFKGSFDWLLSWIFEKRTRDIELVPDNAYAYDYRVVLGQDYDPCRPYLFAPQIFLEQ